MAEKTERRRTALPRLGTSKTHWRQLPRSQETATACYITAYGPHYFRTNAVEVRDYLTRFTEWRDAHYKVQVHTQDRYWSFPINLETFRST